MTLIYNRLYIKNGQLWVVVDNYSLHFFVILIKSINIAIPFTTERCRW